MYKFLAIEMTQKYILLDTHLYLANLGQQILFTEKNIL